MWPEPASQVGTQSKVETNRASLGIGVTLMNCHRPLLVLQEGKSSYREESEVKEVLLTDFALHSCDSSAWSWFVLFSACNVNCTYRWNFHLIGQKWWLLTRVTLHLDKVNWCATLDVEYVKIAKLMWFLLYPDVVLVVLSAVRQLGEFDTSFPADCKARWGRTWRQISLLLPSL